MQTQRIDPRQPETEVVDGAEDRNLAGTRQVMTFKVEPGVSKVAYHLPAALRNDSRLLTDSNDGSFQSLNDDSSSKSSRMLSEQSMSDHDSVAKKRQMNIIYSRRKRQKKKTQEAALYARSAELQRENEELRKASDRLEKLVVDASYIVAQVDQAAALRSLPVYNSLVTPAPSQNRLMVPPKRSSGRQCLTLDADTYLQVVGVPVRAQRSPGAGANQNALRSAFTTLATPQAMREITSSGDDLIERLLTEHRHRQAVERDRLALEQLLNLQLANTRSMALLQLQQQEADFCRSILNSMSAYPVAGV